MTKWMQSQIEQRMEYDSASVERAYAELAASVTNKRKATTFGIDEAEEVDTATRACLEYLGVEPGLAPDGVTDPNERIDRLCRPTGTMRRTVNLDHGWHKKAFGTMLGHLDTGEAVALLPRGVRGYSYFKPGSNRKVRVTNEVASHICTDAVLFYKPLPSQSLTIRDLMSFIVSVFDRSDYLLILCAALAVTLVGLAPAWANQIAFGVVAPSAQVSLILPIAALLLGVAVSSVLIGACRNIVMARVSTKLNVAIEAATFARVLALPSSFFKEYSSGNLASRVSAMSTIAEQMTSMFLGSGLSALLSIVYIFQIGAYAPPLAIPAFIIAAAQGAIAIFATRVTVQYEKETMEASAKMSGDVTALLGGIQKVKLAGAEDRAFAKWAHAYAEYAKPAYNRPVIVRALPAIVALVGLFGNIAIYYFAANAGISVANYMAFNVAYGQVTAALTALAAIARQVAQINPMLDMISPILEATPEIEESKPSVESLSGSIEVSGVSFRYGKTQPYVLKDLSFKIRAGEYVALVGASGCGKSTILRLLLGFEEPERGSILYGPYDISKVDLRSLRQNIGVVMQDGKLFMGDIASNISISTPSATIDDIWEAAEIAGIADDIRKMPMGMHTLVSEGGGGVSGGQRQRIMIARAVCGKRRILVLDEATSALDNKAQKHVSDSLDELKCTRVVVAHRLSTVRHCDRILVVDDGRIAEEGSYDELIEKKGLFADLVKRQQLEEERP